MTGTLGTANPSGISAYGNSVLGADIGSTSNARDFTFTGINYTISIGGITNTSNNPISAPFLFSRVAVQSGNVSINSASATPEPPAISMFALGGAVFIAVRRRQSLFF